MQYTTHYKLTKPQIGERALVSNLNNNSDTLDSVLYQHVINIADEFSTSKTYEVDSYVTYQDKLYKCIVEVTKAGQFNPNSWQQCNISEEFGNAEYTELTGSEYEALPEDKKMDGTMYLITDYSSGVSNYIQAVVYSKEERQIGVWANGKPLYQKTIEGSFENTTTAESVHTVLTASEVTNVLHADTLFITDGSYLDATIVSDSGATCSRDNSGNLVIRIKGAATGTITYRVTVQYTKTTDVAGSGMLTNNALPSVHYMTVPHVVGTWFDGSTMYEITVSAPVPVSISSGSTEHVGTVAENARVLSSEVVSSDYASIGSVKVANSGSSLMVTNDGPTTIRVKYVTIKYLDS